MAHLRLTGGVAGPEQPILVPLRVICRVLFILLLLCRVSAPESSSCPGLGCRAVCWMCHMSLDFHLDVTHLARS